MHEADVGGHVQLARCVPAGLVERDHGVGAARDTATDVVEVKLHGTGVGARKHKRGAGVARGADRAEHISVGIALILGLARPRPLLGPLIDQTVLLPDPHFVLEPDLYRHFRRYLLVGGRRRYPRCKVFLKASMACGSCSGGYGDPLTGDQPSSLRTRPIESSSRSTSKRSLMTRLRSAHRQHHAMPGGIGTGFHDPLQILLLLSRQLGDRPWSFAIDEPLGALLIEAMHPIAQRLPVHR